VGLTFPDIFAQHGDSFSVGIGVEGVSTLDEDSLELFVWKVSYISRYTEVPNSQLVMILSA
jgi:hypothetical protein